MSTKSGIAALVFGLLLMIPLLAQASETDQLKKKILFDQKKLVVMQNMEFTDKEATDFWPIYEQYQEELFQVNQRAARLIIAYASAFQTLTDDQAEKIIADYLEIEKERLGLKEKYTQKFAQVLPGKKAFRYLQVQNKLETIARYEISKEIPLAK